MEFLVPYMVNRSREGNMNNDSDSEECYEELQEQSANTQNENVEIANEKIEIENTKTADTKTDIENMETKSCQVCKHSNFDN